MDKKNLIIFILACTMCIPASGQHSWKIDRKVYSRLPRIENLRGDLEYLTDSLLEGCGRGTSGHEQAAFFLMDEFKEMGLVPFDGQYSRSFIFEGNEYGHNIIGMMAGNASTRERKYIVIGSHYDGHGRICGEIYPGADSNVSGIVGLLEIARTFQRQRAAGVEYDSNIIFVAFDAYMDGRQGGRDFWESLVEERMKDPLTGQRIKKSDISMMIDLDQIGSTMSPVEPRMNDYFIAIGEESLPSAWHGYLERCNWFYYINLDLAFSYYGSKRFTDAFYRLGDRLYFVEGGVPTMYFTSGITSVTNKPEDTAEKINYGVLQRRCTLVFRFTEKCL